LIPRGAAAALAAAAFIVAPVLTGCGTNAARDALLGSGTASAPRGFMYIEGPMVKTSHGWVPYRDVRAYRDGRHVATYHERVLVARDRAAASLLYDEIAHTARPIGGGRAWAFDPCPGAGGVNSFVQLSPSGRAGLCMGKWSAAISADSLVLFDPRAPRSSRRVLLTSRLNEYHPAAWLDERRIAVALYDPAHCPYQDWEWGTSLAVIDRSGRILSRGPCVHGVYAGPRGLVLERRFIEPSFVQDVIAALTFSKRYRSAHFSSDGGRTWRSGRPQFVDGDGRVFYVDALTDEPTLYEDGKPTAFGDGYNAVWARP
jgi:hypothetical protein